MSDAMAVSDKATGEETVMNGEEATAASAAGVEQASLEPPSDPATPQQQQTDAPPGEPEDVPEQKSEEEPAVKVEHEETEPEKIQAEPEVKSDIKLENEDEEVAQRGIKRRASSAFSDDGEEFRGFAEDTEGPTEEFKGFDQVDEKDLSVNYSRVLESMEADITAASASFTKVETVMAVPTAPVRASKRPRQDTDGSRPSSALSSRSDGDGGLSTEGASSSPMSRGRRATTEMGSPLLRVPLDRGWRRELVYRAALDAHSRRNADIYYYTPQGKKLRSTREVSEHLSGTGLTIDNFSFFKEPLGVDDPDKEIIRDAKLMRRVESPVSAPAPSLAVEGKRTPKPKPPKGASPEPSTPKSPPAKIKVKSMGSRLSGSGPSPAPKKKATPSADNNNSAAWKKPRQPAPALVPPVATGVPVTPGVTVTPGVPVTPGVTLTPGVTVTPTADQPPPPPPLQLRPQHQPVPDVTAVRAAVQPCSLTCGLGVPSLSCGACLCLYHPACAGLKHRPPPDVFFCKNCRKSSSPPREPPPLMHKSGVPSGAAVAHAKPAQTGKRVLLRMKVAGGGPDGERVWAVAKPAAKPQAPPKAVQPKPLPQPRPVAVPRPVASPRAIALRPSLPQSLAVLNGRRFIVVPRSMVHSAPHEEKRSRRVTNGAASPPDVTSPRRRGRPRVDDTDYFTAFYNKAQENNYNVVVQIFQYLGMRDLAHSARVCRLWRQLSATPALWRHVRMKNSHVCRGRPMRATGRLYHQVSDWGGLCAALKRHGTKRLDLRKMLLPQNDSVFWEQFAQHIATVDTLERIEMCRCPASAVEAVCLGLPALRALSALAIRDALLDPSPLGALPLLHELRLKSMSGLSLTRDLRPLAALTHLQHLSLTSIKELGWCASDVIGQLEQLESLELGECTFRAEFAAVLGKLKRLRRLRLERGTAQCAAPALLRALSTLPLLTRLELVNIDVKVGFDDALAECKNIQRLLIIPTYVSQSATTNKQVLSGVLRLKDTLTHLMWGVTIELLRVTELFIDQCEQGGERAPRDLGECIPVLKPVPGCRLPDHHPHVAGPPQVEILPLPTLQRLLSAQLPNTKVKLLRIPFHATWRQSLADFQ